MLLPPEGLELLRVPAGPTSSISRFSMSAKASNKGRRAAAVPAPPAQRELRRSHSNSEAPRSGSAFSNFWHGFLRRIDRGRRCFAMPARSKLGLPSGSESSPASSADSSAPSKSGAAPASLHVRRSRISRPSLQLEARSSMRPPRSEVLASTVFSVLTSLSSASFAATVGRCFWKAKSLAYEELCASRALPTAPRPSQAASKRTRYSMRSNLHPQDDDMRLPPSSSPSSSASSSSASDIPSSSSSSSALEPFQRRLRRPFRLDRARSERVAAASATSRARRGTLGS
mmetsp:Transcript_104510/g.185930  ORF Transcript_104510/g.185930 Transcript_104510/m.185930 type:complete len:286 (-) Transcript_104510:933-1790(-)